MASVKIAYSASAGLTVTNLHSVGNSTTHVSGWESDVMDNTTNLYLDHLISGKFTVASAGLAVGEIRVWVVPMLDDSTWPGGFDGVESAETTPLDDANGTVAGAVLLWACATDTTASQVYYMRQSSVASLFGGSLPRKYVLFVTQNTNAALESSGNQMTWRGVYQTVA